MPVARREWQDRTLAAHGAAWTDPRSVRAAYASAARVAAVMGRPRLAARLDTLVSDALCEQHAALLQCLLLLAQRPLARARGLDGPDGPDGQRGAGETAQAAQAAGRRHVSVDSVAAGEEAGEYSDGELSEFSDLTDSEPVPSAELSAAAARAAGRPPAPARAPASAERFMRRPARALPCTHARFLRELCLLFEGFGSTAESPHREQSTRAVVSRVCAYRGVCVHPAPLVWRARTVVQLLLACETIYRRARSPDDTAPSLPTVADPGQKSALSSGFCADPLSGDLLIYSERSAAATTARCPLRAVSRLHARARLFERRLLALGIVPADDCAHSPAPPTAATAYALAARRVLALRAQLLTPAFKRALATAFRQVAGVFYARDPRMCVVLAAPLETRGALAQELFGAQLQLDDPPQLAVQSTLPLALEDGNILTEFFPRARLAAVFVQTQSAVARGDQLYALRCVDEEQRVLAAIDVLADVAPLI